MLLDIEKLELVLTCPKCNQKGISIKDIDDMEMLSYWYPSLVCKFCRETISGSDLSDYDKYLIYKKFGIEILTSIAMKDIEQAKNFIANYFEKSCYDVETRGNNCIYSDVFMAIDDKFEKELYIYEKAIRPHLSFFKKQIKKHNSVELRLKLMKELMKIHIPDNDGVLCSYLKEVFFRNGIHIKIGKYDDGEKFINLRGYFERKS